jgi:hypothetical protein
VHAPSFTAEDEKSPATLLAVTNNGWLVASEIEGGGATLEKSDFSNTLFLELTSIFLFGQLKISFAAVHSSYSVTIRFDTVEDELYREAIDLILAGIDPALSGVAEKDRSEASMFGAWPLKIRNEARRYWPRGQGVLAATHWPAIFGGSHKFGGIITFVPRVRLADFHVGHQQSFDVLALEVRAAHGEEKLEIIFPSDEERAVRKAMEQMLLSGGSTKPASRG